MNKILYITANPKQDKRSASLWVGEKFINEYKKLHPTDEVIHLNLANEAIPTIDSDTVTIWNKIKSGTRIDNLSKEEQIKLSTFDKFADQFVEADKYIFVNPMLNHFIPTKLKAYLDAISVIGKTVRYSSNGPIGLLKEKKALHIQSSGAIYNHDDIESIDFGHKYLKYIMKFLGAESIDGIFIDGLDTFKDKREFLKKQATKKAVQLAQSF